MGAAGQGRAGSASRAPRPRMDELFVKIKGKLNRLWRGLNHEGEVLRWSRPKKFGTR